MGPPRLLAVCLVLAALGPCQGSEGQQESHVIVIAHRGAGHLAPPNTLAAIRHSIALGVDYVEVDLQTTRDGRLVCRHDDTVDRTTNGAGRIRDLTADQIRALDAGSKFGPGFAGEKIPFFDEVLELCRGRMGVYIDVKDAAAEQVARAVARHEMQRQVVVHVYRVAQAREFARLDPALPVEVSPGQWITMAGFASLLVRDLGVRHLDSHVRDWTADAVQEAHRAGAKVWVDIMGDTDNEPGMRRTIEMGVDGIQTDHPDLLLRLLDRAPTGG